MIRVMAFSVLLAAAQLTGCRKAEVVGGMNLSEVCHQWGSPDFIESAALFGTRFTTDTPVVVLIYEEQKRCVFLSRKGIVLGVRPLEKAGNYGASKERPNEYEYQFPDPFSDD
jgi:hypothetical protein